MFSDSTTRRYTPPTCTLEVTESPTSSWARQFAKDLQFRLSFEDPRRFRDGAVQVNGDRTQLEALGKAVESYIQQFLGQTPTPANLAAPAAELTPKLEQPSIPELAASTPLEAAKSQQIQLRPKGYLFHDLFLGSLANETSGPVVNLSVSNLFDLASALEESQSDVAALPSMKRRHSGWLYKAPLWARVAAGAILFIGATLAALQWSHDSASDPTAPAISQGTSAPADPTPLPPPPNATLPPFQNLPPLPSPTTLPGSGTSPAPTPGATSTPAQPALKLQRPTIAPTPQQPKQSIAIQPRATTSSVPLPDVPDLETSMAGNSQSPANQQTLPSSTSTQSNETAFDTVPQVAEVRSYFQQRWKVPSGLKQTLEYTLTLSPNGSIQQTTPLNQAAKVYLDRTPIPLRGEPFVSPADRKNSSKIRLVLKPDGKVQTFLQSAN